MAPIVEGPVRVIERLPTADEYRTLCDAVGWTAVMNYDVAAASLARSLYGVVALHGERTVGMARVVGDGAIYHYLQDVVVDPGYQRRGIGGRMVAQVVAHLHERAPARAFVGVFAAEGTEAFYRAHGFERHRVLTGMFQVVRPG